MQRLIIMTVGLTHSGKTTFAKALEIELTNSVVIDQDNHAEFLHTYYQPILPKEGHNSIKYALTQTIVNYAVNETDCHLILCNANRNRKGRLKLLDHFRENGFTCILVYFDLPEQKLIERIEKSDRSTAILRTAFTFEVVLSRQLEETNNIDVVAPTEWEADHLFIINRPEDVQSVIHEISNISKI